MRRNKIYSLVFVLFSTCFLFAQPTQKIRFAKSTYIYFFQQGKQSDTISNNKSDVFFLHIPDTLKEFVVISVENGQLKPTSTDSLKKLVHIPGLKYESFYARPSVTDSTGSPTQKFKFNTLVNGPSGVAPEKLQIRFIDRRTGAPIIANEYYYSEKK